MIESFRPIRGKISVEQRYDLSSIVGPQRIATTVRQHWHIENQQHRVLDVQFGEDAHRARKDHSAANLAVIRRMALNLIRSNDDCNKSLRRRKMRASCNPGYREQLIFALGFSGKRSAIALAHLPPR